MNRSTQPPGKQQIADREVNFVLQLRLGQLGRSKDTGRRMREMDQNTHNLTGCIFPSEQLLGRNVSKATDTTWKDDRYTLSLYVQTNRALNSRIKVILFVL